MYLYKDEELIEEALNGSNDNNEEDHDGDVVFGPICPKASDVQDVLQVLHDYIFFSLNSEDAQKNHKPLTMVIDRAVATKLTHSDIGTFFQSITVHVSLSDISILCVRK